MKIFLSSIEKMNIRSDLLENHVIEILCAQHQITVPALQKQLKRLHEKDISTAKLYRIVKKLLTEYVLIKDNGLLKLNGLRVNYVLSYGKKMHQSYHQANEYDTLPQGTEYYYANSLAELEGLWTDMTTKILDAQSCEDLYFYDSHLYYILGLFDTGSKVYKNFLPPQGRIFYLVGSDSMLDRYAATLSKNEQLQITHHEKTDFPRSGYSLRVMGEYVIEVYLPENLQTLFDQFFEQVTTIETFDIDLYKSLFTIKARCSMRVHHKQALAQKHIQTIKKHLLEKGV